MWINWEIDFYAALDAFQSAICSLFLIFPTIKCFCTLQAEQVYKKHCDGWEYKISPRSSLFSEDKLTGVMPRLTGPTMILSILEAIVSQNSFAHVFNFMGYRTFFA